MKKMTNNQSVQKTTRRQGWTVLAITAGCLGLLSTGVGANVIHAEPYSYVQGTVTMTHIDPQKFAQMTSGTAAVNPSKVANKTIEVAAGKTFTINREELGSNGYIWTYTTDKGITLVSKSEKAPKGNQAMTTPTIKTWKFKADKAGTYKVTFHYGPAWKKEAKPAETVIYTIKVSDKKATDQTNVVNKTIEAVADKTFDIKLEQNESTGYSWTYKADSQLKLVKASEQATQSKSKDGDPIVGAPTNKTWTFKATKPGTYKVTFKYEREWEKGAKPAQTIIYTVHVK